MEDTVYERGLPTGRTRGLLIAILFLAAFVRFWGINHEVFTDENKVVGPSVTLANGEQKPLLHPRGSYYPHLSHYVFGAAFWVTKQVHPAVTGNTYTVVARAVVAVIATMTVGLLFFIGRALGGSALGIIAALILALIPLHVKYAHYAHVEIPATFVMLAALWAVLRVWETGALRWYVLTGILVGAAGGTQVWGFTIGAVLLLAHGARVVHSRTLRASLRPAFLFGLVAIPVGFFLTSPYVVLDWKNTRPVYERLQLRAEGGDLGYTSPDILWPLTNDSRDWGLPFTSANILRELQPLAAALALFGFVLALYRRDWRIAVLVGVLLLIVYIAIAGTVRLYAVKRLVPLAPLTALLAAYGGVSLWRLETFPRWMTRGVIAATLGGFLFFAGQSILGFDRAYASASTLTIAREWAEEHLPHGSTVLQHGPLVLLSPATLDYRVLGMKEEYANFGKNDDRVAKHRSRSLQEWRAQDSVQYVVLDSRLVDRYYDTTSMALFPDMTASYRAFYDEIRSRGTRVFFIEPKPWQSAGPRIEIYDVRALR